MKTRNSWGRLSTTTFIAVLLIGLNLIVVAGNISAQTPGIQQVSNGKNVKKFRGVVTDRFNGRLPGNGPVYDFNKRQTFLWHRARIACAV